jgi:2,3-bisphosphoglycerate-independent phosphoglycerate mutase
MFELDKKSGEPALNADGRAKAKTSHTLNAVPLHVYAPGTNVTLNARADAKAAPGLANLASTVLSLLGYESPEDFEPTLIGDIGEA